MGALSVPRCARHYECAPRCARQRAAIGSAEESELSSALTSIARGATRT